MLLACLSAPLPHNAVGRPDGDLDGDGFSPSEGDCDDGHPGVWPGAPELCNGLDDDCDPSTLEDEGPEAVTWRVDADGDGWAGEDTRLGCDPPAVAPLGDCNDGDAAVSPSAVESCDGIDNDCDGAVDEGVELAWYADGDGDGWGQGAPVLACSAPPNTADRLGDCDDEQSSASPDGLEVCGNGLDEDCAPSPGCRLSGAMSVDDLPLLDVSSTNARAGRGLAFAGDHDGDGVSSAVVGAPYALNGAGAVYILHGPITEDRGLDDVDVELHGAPSTYLGSSFAHGDLSGDGAPDLAVGCAACPSPGAVFVVPGGSSGVIGTDELVAITGTGVRDRFGLTVSVGDMDGDGAPDLLAGAYNDADGDGGRGHVRIAYGPLTTTREADVDVQGRRSHDIAGYSMDTADLDGDGQADLVVGSPGGRVDRPGNISVLYGPITAASSLKDAHFVVQGAELGDRMGLQVQLGDLDGDGTQDLAMTDGLYQAWVVLGPAGYGEQDTSGLDALDGSDLGGGFTLAVGDLDGDGVDDLAAGAPWDGTYAPNGGQAGSVYLFYGPWSGTREIGDGDAVVHGTGSQDTAGGFLALGEDLTGDGIGDLLLSGDGQGRPAWLLAGAGQ
mgnify:CR=1 FL=1